MFLQDPENEKDVKILGMNASSIPREQLAAIEKKYDGYTITAHEKAEHQVDQYMWPVPVIDKYKMEKNKWNCEFIISAQTPGSNQVPMTDHIVVYIQI